MYLYHANDLPEIFKTYFLSIDQAHHHTTRRKFNENYFVISVRTNSGKNSIKFFGARLRNQIESQLKLYSYYRFKKEYVHQAAIRMLQLINFIELCTDIY